MNAIFLAFVAVAWLFAAATGTMQETSAAIFASARSAVELAIGLVGAMAFFLGVMRVAEEGGLLAVLGRVLRPVMVRLFPEVPPDHPAMGAMILNLASNMLGLGNAATPLGIKAMVELDRLNPRPGTASDAMVLFLAINTSSVALLPTGVVAVRAAAGSADPWGIIGPSIFATTCSTAVGILAAKVLARLPRYRLRDPGPGEDAPGVPGTRPPGGTAAEEALARAAAAEVSPRAVRGLAAVLVAALAVLLLPPLGMALVGPDSPWFARLKGFSAAVGNWVVPTLVLGLLGFGAARGVRVYESFVAGAREGFALAVRIIPYLVAILVVVGMVRASGAMGAFSALVGPALEPLGLPPDATPMAIVRSLSGSGAFAIMSELIETHGPDSYTGYFVSVLNGSTETTFYVLAVYFGAVGITRVRHAVAAGLLADLAGLAATMGVCLLAWGHLR